MTRADRLAEIDDFCRYLDLVHDHVRRVAPNALLVCFGFSQGAATVMRWLDRSRPPRGPIVLWSGTPPEDIDYRPRSYFEQIPLLVRWGDADPLVQWERARQRFGEVGLPYEFEAFAGRHRIEPEPLRQVAESIEGQSG